MYPPYAGVSPQPFFPGSVTQSTFGWTSPTLPPPPGYYPGPPPSSFLPLGGGPGPINNGPVPPPVINPSLPAANMTNSTGGVGCEPGYNYFFPAEHTKLLLFRTGATPPWQLPPHFVAPFHAVHVPVTTTVAELLRGFGATNPDPQKNKIVELQQGGNGRWYKGMSIRGDKDKMMGKTLKSIGWDASRTGLPGQKPVVYLYVTKG